MRSFRMAGWLLVAVLISASVATETAWANQPPVAVAVADVTSGYAPLTVRFDGSGSSDPDGTIVDYEWDVHGWSAYGEIVTWTFENVGIYEVNLYVFDNSGVQSNASTLTITVIQGGSSLVGHWMLDEGSGIVATDSSGSDADGILMNGPVWTAGWKEDALEFDGDNDFVELGQIASAHPLMLAGSDVTIAAWVRRAGGGDTWQRVIDKSNDSWGANGYTLAIDNGTVHVTVNGTDYASSMNVAAGAWAHVAGVITAGGYKIYVNGVEDTEARLTRGNYQQPPEVVTNMRIGTWNHSTAREWKGALDDIRVYNRELDASEIAQLAEGAASPPSPEQYYDYDTTLALVNDLLVNYPSIVAKHGYGTSVEGRELYAVKISDNVDVDEPEPEIGFDGCTHGEEIISSEMIVRFMKDLCESYGSDRQITDLIDDREVWFYPFFNPDGRQVIRRTNSNGVDLNRDYGYMWDGGGGSPYPFSQPETRAALAWVDENQFVIGAHYHAGIKGQFYPWGYKPAHAPDHDSFAYLTQLYTDVSGYLSFRTGQANPDMYATKGTFYDFVYGTRGTLAWLIEVDADKSPPANEIPGLYECNRPSMITLIEQAGFGIEGTVTDTATGDVVSAVIWIEEAGVEQWPVVNDPTVGDYHKFLLPGTYAVCVEANGYDRQEQTGIVVPTTGSVTIDFSLVATFEGIVHAYQVEMCRIPGFNDADENMTPWALGAADGRRYSLGVNGWLVLDMGRAVPNIPGDEIRVIEDDGSPEGYTLQVGSDMLGPWTTVGSDTGTASFDIGAAGVSLFRYVRIQDDGDGAPEAPDAGFDLDAVAVTLTSSSPYWITASAGAGGIIDPSGPVGIDEGASQVFVISADDSYTIDDVVVDGASQGVVDEYVFDGVTSDHTIHATFVLLDPPTEIVVDNLDPNTSKTGTWSVSSAAGPWATNSVYNNAGSIFKWIPAIPQMGDYEVYAWWTYHNNRSSTVPYRVSHRGGVDEVIVDQHDTSLAVQWNLLGTYTFDAGNAGYIEVSSENGQACADAVRIVGIGGSPPPPPPDSLIGHWMLDEGAGTTVADSSGNGTDGTLTNGPVWATGQIAGALAFDGFDDYVDLGAVDIDHPLMLAGSNVTIAAWVNREGTGDPWQRVIDKSNDSWGTNGYTLAIDRGIVHVTVNGTDYMSSVSIPAGAWTHVAGVITAFGYRIYVNGTEDTVAQLTRGSYQQPPEVATTARIGTWNHSTGREWKGALDDIRVYNRELNPSEIANLAGGAQPLSMSVLEIALFDQEEADTFEEHLGGTGDDTGQYDMGDDAPVGIDALDDTGFQDSEGGGGGCFVVTARKFR